MSTVLGRLKSVGYRPSSHTCGKTLPYRAVGLIWPLTSVAARFVLVRKNSKLAFLSVSHSLEQ